MRTRHSARYKFIRGGLLAGSILSFIPAFALVRSNAAAGENSAGTTPSPSVTQSQSAQQPSYTLPSSSLQRQQSAQAIVPRVRTRAS